MWLDSWIRLARADWLRASVEVPPQKQPVDAASALERVADQSIVADSSRHSSTHGGFCPRPEIRLGPCILRGGFSEASTYHASKRVITPVVFLMLPTILRDAVCWLIGHRVPWGEECCARCDRIPGDELAP